MTGMPHRRWRHAALALSALTALAAQVPAPARAAGTLTVCTEAAPDGFDIAQSESSVTSDAAGRTIYDQLIEYRPGTTELVPGLAERWETSSGGLQLTLHLRQGVAFHTTPWFKPTRPMNADDVVFSIRRMADAGGPWQAIAKTGYALWTSIGLAEVVKGVEKVDEHTVRLLLRHPSAPLLNNLALTFTGSVFSAEYAAQLLAAGHPEEIATKPVGTGPFVFASYQKDAVIRYTAHPGYWGGAPAIDKLIFAITPDPNVRVQRLKAGECLVGSNLPGEAAGNFAGTDVQVLTSTVLLTSYVAINTQRGFLADPRLRRALALALDKASIQRSVYGGRAQVATSFLPPAQWSHDATLPDRHDPDEARRLVRASGYDGSEIGIATRIGGSVDARRNAELMQADWAAVGVKTRVQMMEWGEMLKRTARGDYDITFFGWIGSGDPDAFLTPNLSCAAIPSGGNSSRWCNLAFDALIDEARVISDRTRRTALYVKAQRIVYDEVPVIPMVYPQHFVALNRKVQGFVQSPHASLDLRGVSLR